jgi:hypothetical protein
MVNIFVDPVIIMTPTDNQNRADVEVWIDNLDIWLHSVQATDHLQSDGRFPGFTILRDWQRRYQLDINPVQLAKNVNEFFRNEDFDLKHNLYKLEFDFEVEAGSVSIIPV